MTYRKYNYHASQNRRDRTVKLHPVLVEGLEKIARGERKTVSWLVETALSDYFGVEVMLKKLKGEPIQSYDKVRVMRRRKAS